jgi:tRNA A-37 threonylcarbamoyl transferase component Bud32
VFTVRPFASDATLALKVVATEHITDLIQEHALLTKAAELRLPVVRPCSEVEVLGNGLGAALLLSTVGTRVDGKAQARALCEALFTLHDARVFHGDPRVVNAIHSGEKLMWIDMTSMMAGSNSYLAIYDIGVLFRSILGIPQDGQLPEALQEVLSTAKGGVDAWTRVTSVPFRDGLVDLLLHFCASE